MFWLQFTDLVIALFAHYYNCIVNEFGCNPKFGNPAYTSTALSKDEILQNNASVLNTFNISVNGIDEYELLSLY
jgi:hypothetical protein